MFLFGLIFAALVGLAIAAAVLCSACSLVRVQSPDFFFAMVLCLTVGLIVAVLQFAAGVSAALGAGVSLASLKTVADFQHVLERGAMFGIGCTPFVSAGI